MGLVASQGGSFDPTFIFLYCFLLETVIIPNSEGEGGIMEEGNKGKYKRLKCDSMFNNYT